MKGPRFFCDNCGAEVARKLKACPRCGRFFANIRCPGCGFSGEEKLFVSGCPSCGYSAPANSKLSRPFFHKSKAPVIPSGPLPLWVYVFSGLALFVVFVLLVMVVMR